MTCDNNEVLIEAISTVQGTPEYLWATGETTSIITVSTIGTFEVTVTDSKNGCTNVTCITISEDMNPRSAVITGGENITCTNTTCDLDASNSTPSIGLTYEWFGPNGFTSNTDQVTVTIPGIYSLIVTNSINGCTDEAEIEVLEDTEPPIANITGGETLTCINTTSELDASSSSPFALTYEWSGPNNFSANSDLVIVGVAGTYSVTVTNVLNGCTDISEIEVSEDTEPPIANITGGETLTCINTSSELDGSNSTPSANLTYEWSGPNGFSSSTSHSLIHSHFVTHL